MVKAKILQKKSPKKQNSVSKKTPNWFGRFFKKLAGKELAIWITIWFVLMSFLMLFANNLRVGGQSNEIHGAAQEISDTTPWIWQ